MPLQDIPVTPINLSGLDPGDAQYLSQILPFLSTAAENDANRSANARGMFYSGPAQANEQEAGSQIAATLAQQGMSYEEQEHLLQQQQASAEKAAAIQGITGGLGQMAGTAGGLYAAKHLGLIGNGPNASADAAGDVTPGASDLAGVPEVGANLAPDQSFTSGLGGISPATPYPGASAADTFGAGGAADSSAPLLDSAAITPPAEGAYGAGDTAAGTFGAAPATDIAAAPETISAGTPGLLAPGSELSADAGGLGSLGLAGIGAYGAYQLGGGGNQLEAQIGGGVGGAIGEYFGGPLGAAAGTFAGKEVGDYAAKQDKNIFNPGKWRL